MEKREEEMGYTYHYIPADEGTDFFQPKSGILKTSIGANVQCRCLIFGGKRRQCCDRRGRRKEGQEGRKEHLSKFIPVELNRKQISFCSSILDIQKCGEINGAFTQYNYRHAGCTRTRV